MGVTTLGSLSAEVGDSHAAGARAREFDADGHGDVPDDRRIEHARDGARIVQRRVAEAAHATVADVEGRKDFGKELRGGRRDRGNASDLLVAHAGLIGEIQPDHHDLPLLLEDDVGRLGVGADVEFGVRPVVARVHGATHEDDLLDALDDPGLQARGKRDVGERSRRHERHRPCGAAHHGVDDHLHGMPRIRLEHDLVGKRRVVKARLTVDFGRHFGLDHQGTRGARRDRNVMKARHLSDGKRVAGHLGDRLIARHDRDREDVHVRVACSEQDGGRVVVTGVAVENDVDLLVFGAHVAYSLRSE